MPVWLIACYGWFTIGLAIGPAIVIAAFALFARWLDRETDG